MLIATLSKEVNESEVLCYGILANFAKRFHNVI